MKSQGGKKPVRVHLLDEKSMLLVCESKIYVKDLLEQICNMQSVKEFQLFGLAALVENEYQFMDPKQKLSKYAPKEWSHFSNKKESKGQSSAFDVHFRVHFYMAHPKLFSDSQSRHQYYLQLKRNVLSSKVQAQDELLFSLTATALRLDIGVFDESVHKEKYFEPRNYLPQWFVEKWGDVYLRSHLPPIHANLAATTVHDALTEYIQQASLIDDVPAHYYPLYKAKSEKIPSVMLAITNQGIRIYHVTKQRTEDSLSLKFEFSWSKVGRLFFATKRFEIYPEDLPSCRKLVYYTGSNSRSKYLLRLLRETHALFMNLNPFVEHLRKASLAKRNKRYRESYISGLDLDEKMTGLTADQDIESNHTNTSHLEANGNKRKNNGSPSSSRTSGIGSEIREQKQNEEDDPFSDNGELFVPCCDEVICVTQEHLEAPPIKNLSVNNLMNAILSDVDILQSENEDFDTSSVSSPLFSTNLRQSEVSPEITSIAPTHNSSNEYVEINPTLDAVEKLPNSSDGPMYRDDSEIVNRSRKSSHIADILDLFPDVPRQDSFHEIPRMKLLHKSASEDALVDIQHHTTPRIKPLKQPIYGKTRPASSDVMKKTRSRPRRTQSMDLELVFDFDSINNEDTRKETKHHNNMSATPQNNHDFYHKSYPWHDPQIMKVPNSGDVTPLNIITTPRTSVSKKIPKSSVITYSTENPSAKTTSLSRSQKQNNIPFTFGNDKKRRNHENSSERPISELDKTSLKITHLSNELFAQKKQNSVVNHARQSSYQETYDSNLIETYTAKIRPFSATTPQQVALRKKTNQNKPNRSKSRPKSYDFSSNWDSYQKSSSKPKRSSAQRKTMYIPENFDEVIV